MIDVTNFEETTSLEIPPDEDDGTKTISTCMCLVCATLTGAAGI
jgi:hypothetical protein